MTTTRIQNRRKNTDLNPVNCYSLFIAYSAFSFSIFTLIFIFKICNFFKKYLTKSKSCWIFKPEWNNQVKRVVYRIVFPDLQYIVNSEPSSRQIPAMMGTESSFNSSLSFSGCSGRNPPGPSTTGAKPWQKYPGWRKATFQRVAYALFAQHFLYKEEI